MTSPTRKFPKGATARVTIEQGYGDRYVILGGTKQIRGERHLKVRRLPGTYDTTLAPEALVLELDLSADAVRAMDARVAERALEAEEQRKAWDAMEAAKQRARLEAQRLDDLAWDAAEPTPGAPRVYADGSVNVRVAITGRTQEKQDRHGAPFTVTPTHEVEVSVDEDPWGRAPKGVIRRRVNWSAIGSQTPALARAYARAILAAADLAEQLEPAAPAVEEAK